MEMFSSDEEDTDTMTLSQESDSNELPDISLKPPVLQEGRPHTPGVPGPGLLLIPTSSQSTQTLSLSSLEHLSPLKASGVDQKMKESAKLVQKVADLSEEIKCKEEMDRKVKKIIPVLVNGG